MANLKVSPDVDLLMQGTNKAEMQIAIGLPAVGLDGEVLTADSAEATGLKWATPAGDMSASVYDPTTIQADAFARVNHTGTQLASTISDFDTAVSNNAKLAGYSPIAIITESTTARSLALTDIGAYIRLTNAVSCTITLPANATVAWAGETEPPTIYFRAAAAGIPTLSNAGVTVNDTLGVVAALEAGSTFALQWVATDVWDII